MTNALAALLGAVVGGIFTLLGGWLGVRWQSRAAIEADLRARRTHAYSEFAQYFHKLPAKKDLPNVEVGRLHPQVAGFLLRAYGTDELKLAAMTLENLCSMPSDPKDASRALSLATAMFEVINDEMSTHQRSRLAAVMASERRSTLVRIDKEFADAWSTTAQ